jgi:mono/diheme cytochrome c family protein
MSRWRWSITALLLASASSVASPTQDYVMNCMGCHGATAEGVPGKVPPLAHTLVQFMRSAAGRSYVLRVPGASNSMLSDAQLAAVLNWIAGNFGRDQLPESAPPFSAQEVGATRRMPMVSLRATRREVLKELAASGSAPPEDY